MDPTTVTRPVAELHQHPYLDHLLGPPKDEEVEQVADLLRRGCAPPPVIVWDLVIANRLTYLAAVRLGRVRVACIPREDLVGSNAGVFRLHLIRFNTRPAENIEEAVRRYHEWKHDTDHFPVERNGLFLVDGRGSLAVTKEQEHLIKLALGFSLRTIQRNTRAFDVDDPDLQAAINSLPITVRPLLLLLTAEQHRQIGDSIRLGVAPRDAVAPFLPPRNKQHRAVGNACNAVFRSARTILQETEGRIDDMCNFDENQVATLGHAEAALAQLRRQARAKGRDGEDHAAPDGPGIS